MRQLCAFCLVVTACLLAITVRLQTANTAKGAVIIRLEDGISIRCINQSTDRIWLSMRRLVTNKDKKLFAEDRAIGVLINTTIEGATGGKPEKIAFPRMVEANVQDYESGQGVSVPIEIPILTSFLLRAGSDTYTNVQFDFSVVRRRKRTSWGNVLDGLVAVTKKLPIPSSPFADGFRFFAEYANHTVEKSLSHEDRAGNLLKESSVSLSFSPNGQCTEADDFARVGTIAVVRASSGTEAQGYIDINRLESYCLKSEFRPAFALKFSTRGSNRQCADSYKLVQNDYIGFFLNAFAEGLPAGKALRQDTKVHMLGTARPWTARSVSRKDIDDALRGYSESAGLAGWLAPRDRFVSGVATAARSRIADRQVPFGEIVHETGSTMLWKVTQEQFLWADMAQSLQRCQVHGVKPMDCFRK